MGRVNRRIGKSSETANVTADGTGGGVLDTFLQEYFNRSGNAFNQPGSGAVIGMSATGGVVSDYSEGGAVYRTHVFRSSGIFSVSSLGEGSPTSDAVEYLVVAGGGGGGSTGPSLAGGGGGGAGGLRTNLSGHPLKAAPFPVSPGPYTVTVGAGGAGLSPQLASGGSAASNGGNSEFYPTPQSYPSAARVRSVGGGGGGGGAPGSTPMTSAGSGGSGGGAGLGQGPPHGPGSGNTPTDPNHPQVQGYAGGSNPGPYSHPIYPTAGGGGAGGAGMPGGSAPAPQSGHGGIGVQVLIGGPSASPQPIGAPGPGGGTGWFAGGGGGAMYPGGGEAGTGGAGPGGGGPYAGGGNGGPSPHTPSGGTASTGGGGGGIHNALGPNGGSGIVVVRYQIATLQDAKATGGTISFRNNKTVHVFTSSGEFVNTSGSPLSVDYLVVGGGGAGGGGENGAAGGGGAGGLRTSSPEGPGGGQSAEPSMTVAPGSPAKLTITIGAGAAQNAADSVRTGANGSSSVIQHPSSPNNVDAPGGGGGGYGAPNPRPNNGQNGGSSGGGANNTSSAGSVDNPVSGYVGGTGKGDSGPSSTYRAGGGGGAGSVGEAAGPSLQSGDGGAGKRVVAFLDPNGVGWGFSGPGGASDGWLAGGGGGGSGYETSGNAGTTGGYGGGAAPARGAFWSGAGDGITPPGAPPMTYLLSQTTADAKINSGSGGGGGGFGRPTYNPNNPQHMGGRGGSGLVVIVYPT